MPIWLKNVREYVKEHYGEQSNVWTYLTIPKIKSFLQKDYGEDNDCTLVSIMTIVNYLRPTNAILLYNLIESQARQYGYKNLIGTIPFFNTAIFNRVLKQLGLKYHTKQRMFKGIGWSIDDIIKEIQNNCPCLLSLYKDGNNYYTNHSVTVIGYVRFEHKGKPSYLLQVYDNWNSFMTYIDYQKLSRISSITTLVNG